MSQTTAAKSMHRMTAAWRFVIWLRHLNGISLIDNLVALVGLFFQKEDEEEVETKEGEDDDEECVDGREDLEAVEKEDRVASFGDP